MKKVLYVNQTLGHKQACGIGIIGDLIADTLVNSNRYNFKIVYADEPNIVRREIDDNTVAIIYHYSKGSTPWVDYNLLLQEYPDLKHIKTHHDMTQDLIDSFSPDRHGGFNYIIADDPTLTSSENVFTTQRLIPPYLPIVEYDSEAPVIGFQGFGPKHKGFHRLVNQVQQEFDEAIIRVHIPAGYYGDPKGINARKRVNEMRSMVTKPNISIVASHDFLSIQDLIDLLAQNTINCYFYDYLDGCGLASSPDFAMAARRPIAITRSHQFRNLWPLKPSIQIEDRSLKQIIASGLKPLLPLYDAYTPENVIRDYERILDFILKC